MKNSEEFWRIILKHADLFLIDNIVHTKLHSSGINCGKAEGGGR